MTRPQRVMVLGFDGAMPEHLERFVGEGIMPNIRGLMKNGAYARALPCVPVDTPTNWTTIVTGAWPGTHGITSFTVHLPGEPLDVGHQTVGRTVHYACDPSAAGRQSKDRGATDLCRAEYIWDTAERAGKKSLILNYVSAWPPTAKSSMIVGGMGLFAEVQAAPARFFATDPADCPQDDDIPCSGIVFAPAEDWTALPDMGNRPLAADGGVLTAGEGIMPGHNVTYELLLLDGSGNGYDEILVCNGLNASTPLARLRTGCWSEWLYATIFRNGTEERVGFKLRVCALARNGSRCVLFRSALYRTRGWTYPEELADEIVDNVAVYAGGREATPGWGYPDLRFNNPELIQVWKESSSQHLDYLVDTARFLSDAHGWDMLFMHVHLQDILCHHPGYDAIDPSVPDYDPARAEQQLDIMRTMYRAMDAQVGRFARECADENTVTVVISDHAAVPFRKVVMMRKVLQAAGLLVVRRDEKTGAPAIDWSRTRACCPFFLPEEYIWVNVKGRDPDGIVEPGAEYENVRDETIRALRGIQDPETGDCPVAQVLRKEDAGELGHHGDRCSDLLFFFKPGYGMSSDGIVPFEEYENDALMRACEGYGDHSGYLPSARSRGYSNSAVFVMSGPGVRRGVTTSDPIRLLDVAPTIAHLLGMEIPAQSAGGVLDEFLL
jgi:predicted AlkP superfamily phosphohydrolase/phosphomutase